MARDPLPLRLGVMGAVVDRGRLLLSRRGDFNVWALPGGRLDRHETLMDGVIREVREETGLEVEIVSPQGMYFLAGLRRLNILFICRPVGGVLRARTSESRDNRWFAADDLPDMPLRQIAEDAFGAEVCHRTIVTPPAALRRLRLRLAMRYIRNALQGRREPAFPVFQVSAAALISSPSGRIAVRTGKMQSLPRVICHGESAIWEQLADALREDLEVRALRDLRWSGVWMQPERDQLEFVFGGRVDETALRQAAWTAPRTGALSDRDSVYAERSRSSEKVWWLVRRERSAQPGDTLVR